MLYMLANIPMHYSFYRMTDYAHKLVTFARFRDYLDNWFEQTSQMKSLDVMETDFDIGRYQVFSQVSYLTKEFFDEFKNQKSEKESDEEEGDEAV